MRSVKLGSAVLAGVVGTVIMTMMMYAAPLMGLPRMDLLAALGSMLPLGISPYLVGGLLHLTTGVVLAVLYAAVFERILPGPHVLRGAAFAVLPWLFAITLMGPAVAWWQAHVNPAEAATAVNPCAAQNPCALRPPASAKPANPCAAAAQQASGSWLPQVMSLMAHLVYGGVVAVVYRRRT